MEVARLSGSHFVTMESWQAVPRDQNGHFADPAAMSGSSWTSATATDLHFVPSDVRPANGNGIAGLDPGVPADIDGEARNAYAPTAGCDEVIDLSTRATTDWALFR